MPVFSFVADNPAVAGVQIAILILAALAVFFVIYTTRDILLRTRSFLLQFFCILIVTALPIVGFLIYLIIRPARTVKQRETDLMLRYMAGIDREWTEQDMKQQWFAKEKEEEGEKSAEKKHHAHHHGAKKAKPVQ